VTDDLVKRLRVLSGMMAMGEPIKFGSDSFAMDEAADRIEQLEVALREINARLNDNDSWLAQSIDCRNIAESALGEKKDGN